MTRDPRQLAAYNLAWSDFGETELPGEKHNPKIVSYFKSVSLDVEDDDTSWCSAFINALFDRVGFERTDSARARSWQTWGEETHEPQAGDIVVLDSSVSPAHGHVGFLVWIGNNHIALLGGNQDDTVSLKTYPMSRVLTIRCKYLDHKYRPPMLSVKDEPQESGIVTFEESKVH